MSRLTLWGPHVARVLLALPFLFASLSYFLPFMPAPEPGPMSDGAIAFFTGLEASGYVMPVVKVVELTAAIALLSNRFVPLALTLLAPILVNIAAIHLFLVPPPTTALVLVALALYLAWVHRAAFQPLFRGQLQPAKVRRSTSQAGAPSTVTT